MQLFAGIRLTQRHHPQITQIKRIKQLYHGKAAGIKAQINMLIDLNNPYAQLFDTSTVAVTKLTTTTNQKHSLKQIFHRGHGVFTIGDNITTKLLSRACIVKTTEITGRTLFKQVKEAVVLNVNKAIAAAYAYLRQHPGSDGLSFPSGFNHDDLYEHVVDVMYEETKKKMSLPSIRDSAWFFQGWFLFLLFSPIGIDVNNHLSIFSIDD